MKKLIVLLLILTSIKSYAQTPGGALDFDGMDDAISAGNNLNAQFDTLNTITLEAWVKPTDYWMGNIVGNLDDTQGNFQFKLAQEGDYFTFMVNNTSYVFTGANTVALNVWQHVAATWDGYYLKIYINGILKGTTLCRLGSFISTTNDLIIGNSLPYFGNPFYGSIDEVRIWSRALCQAEIQNNMNAEITVPQANLLSYYNFNQGLDNADNSSENTLINSVLSSNNGVLGSFDLIGSVSNWISPGAVANGIYAPSFGAPSFITVNPGDTITAQQTFTISPSGATTYTFSPNGPIVNPQVCTTYTITGGNSTGCPGVAYCRVDVYAEAIKLKNSSIYLGNSVNTILDSAKAITVESMVNPHRLTGNGVIIGNYDVEDTSGQFALRQEGSEYVFTVNDGTGTKQVRSGLSSVTLRAWQHVAGVWDGQKLLIYIDGILKNTLTNVNGPSLTTHANSITIGSNNLIETFDGLLDETKIWTKPLCSSEILHYKDAELPLPQQNLLAYYKYNQGLSLGINYTVSNLHDSSPTQLNGSLGISGVDTISNWIAPSPILSGIATTNFISPIVSISGNDTTCANTPVTLSATSNVTNFEWVYGPLTSDYTFSPSVTNTYTVIVSDNNGCQTYATKTVFVNTPVIDSVRSNISCGTAASTLYASALVGTVSWFSDTTSISPLYTGDLFTTPLIDTTTTYYVQANNVCGTSIRQAVIANVIPTPTGTLTPSGTTTFCQGGSVDLQVTASSNEWLLKNMPGGANRIGGIAFSIGDKGYAGFGYMINYFGGGATVYLNDLSEYDYKTDTWTQKSYFPAPPQRADAVVFVLNGKAYMGTGGNATTKFNDFWEYNPITNSWLQLMDVPGGNRKAAVAFSIGNKGYVGTGFDATQKNDFYEYNPTTNNWLTKAVFAGGSRQDAVGFSIGNKGYIATGLQGSSYMNDIWEYNATNDTWVAKTNMPATGRKAATAVVMPNKVMIALGNNSTDLDDSWEYNPINDSWTQLASYPNGVVSNAIGFCIGPKAYVGFASGGPYPVFSEYIPTATYSWSDGSTTSSITATLNSNYIVEINYTQGCSAFLSEQVTVNNCTSIEKNTLLDYLQVFPNPNSGDFTIVSNYEGEYSIHNALGQLITRFKIDSISGNKYQIGNFSSGVYFITGKVNNNIIQKKIVVQN